jgi:N-acetylmuramoyl-L-alanine amidase
LKILIDPGHGGSDPGAVAGIVTEKDVNLALAKETKDILLKFQDVDVQLTRDTDINMTLAERVGISASWKPDLFISIHCNAGGGTGMESYIRKNPIDDEVKIQQALHTQVMKFNVTKDVVDRGMKREDYYVLVNNPQPSILFEVLFVDTPKDQVLLMDTNYRHYWCNELAYAISVYYNLQRKPEKITPIGTTPVVKEESTVGDLFNYIIQSLQSLIDVIKSFKT